MNHTEAELVNGFLKSLHHLAEHTRSAYQQDLNHIQAYCDQQEIAKWSDLDGRQIRGFVAWRHRQGIGGRSLQRNLSAVRSFYRYLLKEGKVKNNPAEG
ncbi:MAG: site-specific integrase, partial [Proteobacteria bacterium]|nr:site-specific integrase [Pseudomonadota bacterium]